MRLIKLAVVTFLVLLQMSARSADSSSVTDDAYACFHQHESKYSEVLNCYREAHKKEPLKYSKAGVVKINQIEKSSYELISQSWHTKDSVTPEQWSHLVDIYVPDHARSNRALLIINNGINNGFDKNLAKGSTDYSDDTLVSIASKTQSIVISISNVPNQYLKYEKNAVPKKEDDSVAYSWKLFLEKPNEEIFSSLHIAMMEAAVKAMDLVEVELVKFNIHRFIVAGTSKRAWTAWHTAIADERIDAVVPFVIDILNTKKVLEHEYQTFGSAWPITFKSYVSEGVTDSLNTNAFEKLMQIEDPLKYFNSAYASRLSIPKYIVNASGDSFFVPDNTQLYFENLPGVKILRVAPNTDHYGINKYTEESLVPFVNRIQSAIPMPSLTAELVKGKDNTTLRVSFSENPIKVVKWSAMNPDARDFRFSCGVRYVEKPVEPDASGNVEVKFDQSEIGWTAHYVEATFKDGLVVTSQVYISPENRFPNKPGADKESICKTLH